MTNGQRNTTAEIESMTREEAEIVAARLLVEIVRVYRLPLRDGMQITHLAARLEGFAQKAMAT